MNEKRTEKTRGFEFWSKRREGTLNKDTENGQIENNKKWQISDNEKFKFFLNKSINIL